MDCASACALDAQRDAQGKLQRIYGSHRNPATAGIICAKVARYRDLVYHPARLKTPLKRIDKQGIGIEAFKEISWDEALDITAEAFIKAEQEYGAQSVWPYFYGGAGPSRWVRAPDQRQGVFAYG